MLDPRLWVSGMGATKLLRVGDPAPPFSARAHDGSTVRLEELAGQKILLWFYPAADTPG